MSIDDERYIEKSYEKAFSQLGEIQTIFPLDAKIEMAKMVEQIARADQHIKNIINTNQGAAQQGGFIAEEFHAETYNLDAIYKEKIYRAVTDKHNEWPFNLF